MTDNREQLIDALQVIALRAQRLDVSAKQQEQDVAALLDATRRAVQLVQARQRPSGND